MRLKYWCNAFTNLMDWQKKIYIDKMNKFYIENILIQMIVSTGITCDG